MMQGETPELRRIVRWLEGQFEEGQLVQVERVTKNAVRITDRWGDTAGGIPEYLQKRPEGAGLHPGIRRRAAGYQRGEPAGL